MTYELVDNLGGSWSSSPFWLHPHRRAGQRRILRTVQQALPKHGPQSGRSTTSYHANHANHVYNWESHAAPLSFIWVKIQKEVISDLKRENQFLAKEMVYDWSIKRDLYRPVLKLDFTAHGIMESLSEFGLCAILLGKRIPSLSHPHPDHLSEGLHEEASASVLGLVFFTNGNNFSRTYFPFSSPDSRRTANWAPEIR